MSLLDTASLIVTPNGYKEGKLYSVIPSDGSGDLSVTRATTATRVNSAGLVELVPYNLLQYSQQFDNGYWIQFNSTITANNTTAPDGTLTADRINLTGGFGSTYVNSFSFSGNQTTISCYFKKGTNTTFYIDSNGTAGYFGAGFNLDTEVITPFGSVISSNIENLNNNGWYRCSLVVAASGSNYIAFGIQQATIGLTGYLWGAQVNEGTIKPYQKTETRLNIPRLDYSNGTCPSILVEPQRTNSCLWSNNLSISPWINQTLNTTLTRIQNGGPDGNAFDRLVVGGSGYVGRYVQGITQVGTNTTFTAYLRGSGSVQLGVFNMGQTYLVTINLTSEWTRYENIVTTATNNTYMDVGIYLYGGTQVDVSSCQVEFATYATSYIPTTSATVTRNADVISKTGISSLIGQTEGTLFVDCDCTRTAGIQLGNSASGSDYVNSIQVAFGSSSTNVNIFNGGVPQFLYASSALTGHHKLAIAYKANDFALYIDGVQVATDTSGSIPSLSALVFNHVDLSTQGYLYNSVALWKTRLTNAQLATLTTI